MADGPKTEAMRKNNEQTIRELKSAANSASTCAAHGSIVNAQVRSFLNQEQIISGQEQLTDTINERLPTDPKQKAPKTTSALRLETPSGWKLSATGSDVIKMLLYTALLALVIWDRAEKLGKEDEHEKPRTEDRRLADAGLD